MMEYSIALYKLLGIDMNSDPEMIKMQLHAQDYVAEVKLKDNKDRDRGRNKGGSTGGIIDNGRGNSNVNN